MDTTLDVVSPIQEGETPAIAEVTGPTTFLMYPPSEWDKRRAMVAGSGCVRGQSGAARAFR